MITTTLEQRADIALFGSVGSGQPRRPTRPDRRRRDALLTLRQDVKVPYDVLAEHVRQIPDTDGGWLVISQGSATWLADIAGLTDHLGGGVVTVIKVASVPVTL